MATWKDGPRYAPLTRPIGFAEPSQAVSLAPDELPPQPPDPGPVPPAGFVPQGPAVPLDAVAPAPASVRDPATPFPTISSLLTDQGSSDAAQSRAPKDPFHVASSAPVLASSWAPPAETQVPVQPVRKVAASDCWAAAYPPFIVTLAVAGIVGSVQPVLAVLLLAVSPFVFVPRVRFRVPQLRKANLGVIAVLAALWVVSLILDSSTHNIDLHIPMWVLIGCWVLAVVDVVLQWLALRNGETPNHT